MIVPITKGSPNASSVRLILPVSSDHIVPAVNVLIHFLHDSGLFARGGDSQGEYSPDDEPGEWTSRSGSVSTMTSLREKVFRLGR